MYGAQRLVTANLDSGQIGWGKKIFFDIPRNAPNFNWQLKTRTAQEARAQKCVTTKFGLSFTESLAMILILRDALGQVIWIISDSEFLWANATGTTSARLHIASTST